MTKLQFRTLYREFLFRLVDLELLSPDAQGDAQKLVGRLAGLLAVFSVYLGLGGLLVERKAMPAAVFRTLSWSTEHFLISTTMLIVGLFAVLSWDATFPDRRDVLVLAPLPIRARTFFFAKVAAVGTGLGLAIAVFNAGPGLTWPVALGSANPGFFDILLPFAHRTFFAYWMTMAAAGTFLFCCVLSLQGFAALLPRRIFLRVSGILQLAAFCGFVSAYFLEPPIVTRAALENAWLPDYWFFGVFQQLSGAATPETAGLAERGWVGLAIAAAITAAAYAVCYFRVLRRIPEEPDLLPGARRLNLFPRFGAGPRAAIVEFSVRGLARSRQHRVILAFYLGIGFALLILLSRTAPRESRLLPLFSDAVILCFWVVGMRIVFTMPLDLRANWIFRVTPVRGGRDSLAAARLSLYLLAWLPVWTGSAAWFFSNWPWRMAVAHLVAIGLAGALLVELCVYRFQKIPFTCSWLPGKSNLFFALAALAFLLQGVLKGAVFELNGLGDASQYARMIGVLVVSAGATRWLAVRRASADEPVVQFEEEEAPALLGLGLFRDGVFPAGAAEARLESDE